MKSVALAVTFACFVTSGVVHAQVAVLPETLTLRDAIALTISANPKLIGQKYALAAADARKEQASLSTAYEVGLEVEDVLGTGAYRSAKSAQATLQLGKVIELGGKRQKRIAAAEYERELLSVEKQSERLDLLSELTRRFILVLAEQERLKLAEQNRGLSSSTTNLVNDRVRQGRSSAVEVSNAKLSLAQADIAIQEQRAILESAWASLVAAWAGPPTQRANISGTFFELPATPSFGDVSAAIEQNPDIVRFASERRVNEAKLRLAEANRSPDLSAGVGVRQLQATKDQALVFSVSVPLGTSGRSAPFEREAQSRLDLGRFEEQAARQNITATVYGLRARAEAARQIFDQLQVSVLPEAMKAERSTEEGFRSGRLSLLELTLARQSLLAVRQQAVTAAATYHQLYLELERLTGQSMTTPEIVSKNAP